MLPRKNRIVREKDVQNAVKTKFRKTGKFVNVLLSPSVGEFKLLVSVSKKIYKRAYLRFRIRRKINAVFEEMKSQNQLPNGFSCFIQVSKKDALFWKKDEIKDELSNILIELYLKIPQNRIDKK